ncbi:hypothetical protein Dimus_039503 [Dionaea muscipula]
MELIKENKKLMDDLASKEVVLTSREADLTKLSELFKAEEQKNMNLETVLESARKEKESAEEKILKLEAMLEEERRQREKVEHDLRFSESRLKMSKDMQEILHKKNTKLETSVTQVRLFIRL